VMENAAPHDCDEYPLGFKICSPKGSGYWISNWLAGGSGVLPVASMRRPLRTASLPKACDDDNSALARRYEHSPSRPSPYRDGTREPNRARTRDQRDHDHASARQTVASTRTCGLNQQYERPDDGKARPDERGNTPPSSAKIAYARMRAQRVDGD